MSKGLWRLLITTCHVWYTLGSAAGCSIVQPEPSPQAGLGPALYSVLCDRVGAQALREDLTGASFHDVCHPRADGSYADEVNRSALPPIRGAAKRTNGTTVSVEQQKESRELQIARIEALGRRRVELIQAIENLLPDIEIPAQVGMEDAQQAPAAARGLRKELTLSLGRFLDLYADRSAQNLTDALGDVLTLLENDTESHTSLARLINRNGYQPADLTLGIMRPVLSYPQLPNLLHATLNLIVPSSDRKADASKSLEFNQELVSSPFRTLLQTVHFELQSVDPATPERLSLAQDTQLPERTILSRPRTSLELAKHLLFTEHESFKVSPAPLVVRRDKRGVALVARRNGTLPRPFIDDDDDGLADVDAIGRFITQGSAAPTPFFAHGVPEMAPRDAMGRALKDSAPIFDYLEASRTFLASAMKDARNLFLDNNGNPRDTLVDLLAIVPALAGKRAASASSVRQYPAAPSSIRDTTTDPPREIAFRYRGFSPASSPLVDLVHAVGLVAADPAMDDAMALFQKLLTDRSQDVARLTALLFRFLDSLEKHPNLSLPDGATVVDDLLEFVMDIAQEPLLLEDVLASFTDDRVLSLGKVLTAFMTYRDELTYQRDPNAPEDEAKLNGLAFNRSLNKVIDPNRPYGLPVDRNSPDSGDNRSILQRVLQMAHDTNGVRICTKEGAVAHVKIRWPPDSRISVPINFDYPTNPLVRAVCAFVGGKMPTVPMPACGIFNVDDIGTMISEFITGDMHIDMPDPCLNKIVNDPVLTAFVGDTDRYLAQMSGVRGLSPRSPTINAIARLGFFETPYTAYPSSPAFQGDAFYPKTRDFLKNVLDPVPTVHCPVVPVVGSDGRQLNLRVCKSFSDTLRGRHPSGVFPLETMGFLEAVRPLGLSFAAHKRPDMMVKFFEVLHRHWGSQAQAKEECDPSVARNHPRWCTQDGISQFEPILADVAGGDLFPALQAFMRTVKDTQVAHCEAYDPTTRKCTKTSVYDGIHVLSEAARVLMDPKRWPGLKDRDGQSTARRPDGTSIPKLSPAVLMLQAIRNIERAVSTYARENTADGNLEDAWRTSLEHLVRTLLGVEGVGSETRFKNRSIPAIAPLALGVLRSQIAAHCPPPIPAQGCTWARQDLSKSIAEVIASPLFSSITDLMDLFRRDASARAQVERFIAYLLDKSSDANVTRAMVAVAADTLEILDDEQNLRPLLRLIANMTAERSTDQRAQTQYPSLAEASINALAHLFVKPTSAGNEVPIADVVPNRAIGLVLQHLVTPTNKNPSPLEVFASVVASVNRQDPRTSDPLGPEDMRHVTQELRDFVVNPASGLARINQVISSVVQSP